MHGLMAGIELIERGGFMMYPLLLSALLALTVIIERYWTFARLKTAPRLISNIFDKLETNDVSAARGLCKGHEHSALVDVIARGLERFGGSESALEMTLRNRAEGWIPIIEKRLEVLDTVITAAPLMGLLGTITGMMASFQVLAVSGVNEPHAITGGVAEALIATATGLGIALLSLLAYNHLTSQVKATIYELESVASRLLEMQALKRQS